MKNLLKVKYVIENGKKKNNFFYGTKFPDAIPYKTALHNHGNAEILFNFSIKKATLKKDNGETVEIVPDYKNNKIIRSEYNGND